MNMVASHTLRKILWPVVAVALVAGAIVLGHHTAATKTVLKSPQTASADPAANLPPSCATTYPVGSPPKPQSAPGQDLCEWMGVLDHVGKLRGYASRVEWNDPNQHTAPGDPGTPVVDSSGALEGYVSTAFIDLQTAKDPALVAQVKAHPDMILDADGNLVTAADWMQRLKDGSAKVR
jgi:hypothetical protein